MQASVYRLRKQGVRLPRPDQPTFGQLVLAPFSQGDRTWLRAQVVDGTRDMLPPLHQATVKRITKHGIVIRGVETLARSGSPKSSSSQHPQTWWVMVWTGHAIDEMDGEDPLDHIAHRGEMDYLVRPHTKP